MGVLRPEATCLASSSNTWLNEVESVSSGPLTSK